MGNLDGSDVENTESFALLDNNLADDGVSYLYRNATAFIKCDEAKHFPYALRQLDAAQKNGQHAVGYISYDAAEILNPALSSFTDRNQDEPFLYFGLFDDVQALTDIEVQAFLDGQMSDNRPFLCDVRRDISDAAYLDAIEKIGEHLKRGDTYQVNYTYKNLFKVGGCLMRLYDNLRRHQPVEYGSFLNFPDLSVLSRSPELFYRKDGTKLMTKPMKGTAARDPSDSVQDQHNATQLRNDTKSQAENVIVVDLLRNDLGQIADIGSVKVDALFALETYNTVHQLTSTISCSVAKEMKLERILTALFPCGSITGAPKARTTQIINKLEQSPRGIYTGAIGRITPQNDMCFNVPIRTTLIDSKRQGTLGVGGGIVVDSDPVKELEETRLKSKFLLAQSWGLNLIESFYFDEHEGCRYLEDHLNRLEKAAGVFEYQFDRSAIRTQLETYVAPLSGPSKVRVELSKKGVAVVNDINIDSGPKLGQVVSISAERVNSNDPTYSYKTTNRHFYNRVLKQHRGELGSYDVLFLNELGQVTETTMHNIFIRNGAFYQTPALDCGVLDGVGRLHFLKNNPNASEAILGLDDLKSADEVLLVSSVRGQNSVEMNYDT